MRNRSINSWTYALVFIVLISLVFAEVETITGPDSIINISNSTRVPEMGYMLNTSGGTITTININATMQNPHWKGFVGNISGVYTLQDATANALYDWSLTTKTGEIYATRNSNAIDWDIVVCANESEIANEEYELNVTRSNPDSINKTFSHNIHDEFFAGTVQFEANECYTTATNVNNETQTSDFQELILSDGNDLIYATIIENSTVGYDGNLWDFQMIVPDYGLEQTIANAVYYLYIELI